MNGPIDVQLSATFTDERSCIAEQQQRSRCCRCYWQNETIRRWLLIDQDAHTHTHTELTVLHCSLINSDRRDAVVTAAAAASLCTIALPAISNWNSSSSIQNKAEPMTFDDGPLSTASSALLLLIPRGAANCCCPPALWLISLSGNSALVSTSQSVSLCWTVLSAWDLLFFHASKLCGDFFFHCDALVLVFSCVSIFSFLYILFKSVNSDDHKASEIKLI